MKKAAAVVLAIAVTAGAATGVRARVNQSPGEKPQAAAGPVAGPRTAETQQTRARAERVLRFPATRALGILYVQDGDELDVTATPRVDPWRRLGEARGVVRLPAGGMVRLDVSQAALDDLSPLDDLAPDAIGSLRLHQLGAKDDALRHVGHLTGLKEINLGGNFITNAGLASLKSLLKLESVSLGDSLIGDDGIRQIARLPSIRSLGLHRSQITDGALRLIGKMKMLVILDLWKTRVTDRGIAQIKPLENLRRLRFGDTNTTDASLAVVGGLTRLESLDFDKILRHGLRFGPSGRVEKAQIAPCF